MGRKRSRKGNHLTTSSGRESLRKRVKRFRQCRSQTTPAAAAACASIQPQQEVHTDIPQINSQQTRDFEVCRHTRYWFGRESVQDIRDQLLFPYLVIAAHSRPAVKSSKRTTIRYPFFLKKKVYD
jgi:hypothetical protein